VETTGTPICHHWAFGSLDRLQQHHWNLDKRSSNNVEKSGIPHLDNIYDVLWLFNIAMEIGLQSLFIDDL